MGNKGAIRVSYKDCELSPILNTKQLLKKTITVDNRN